MSSAPNISPSPPAPAPGAPARVEPRPSRWARFADSDLLYSFIHSPVTVVAALVTLAIFAAALLAPIGISIAQSIGVSPFPVLMAIGIAASCAFTTPVATPPNAIVYGAPVSVDNMIVIDRSGSMAGAKIEAAKGAAKVYIDSYESGDRIGVVSFNDTGRPVADINAALRQRGVFGGHDLSREFPELGQCALYCVTEVHGKAEIDRLATTLQEVLA